jgi:uncharacterized protein (TIGR00266 family)
VPPGGEGEHVDRPEARGHPEAEPVPCEQRAHGGTLPAGRAAIRPVKRRPRRHTLRSTIYDQHRPVSPTAEVAVEATIREGHAPALVVSLAPGEELVAEPGAMLFTSGEVAMELELPGGVAAGLKRAVVAGESIFLTRYTARGPAAVGLTGPFPGSIRAYDLDGELICERRAYLAHAGEVTLESAFAKKLGGSILGGEGFVLQRVKGKGTVWLHGGGDFVDFDLVDGQTLVVDTGCMVMMEPTVRYDVRRQAGLKKSLLGGEGLFLVYMTGPGHVTLQTLPFSRTAERIVEAARGGRGETGGLIGNIFGG